MTLLSDALALLRLSATTWRSNSDKARALLYGVRPDGSTGPAQLDADGKLIVSGTLGSGSASPVDVAAHHWALNVGNASTALSALMADTFENADGVFLQARGGGVVFRFTSAAVPRAEAFILADGQPLRLTRSEAQAVHVQNAVADTTPKLVAALYGARTPQGG